MHRPVRRPAGPVDARSPAPQACAAVKGVILTDEGTSEPLDAAALRAAPEAGLRLLSLAVPLLAAALLLARLVD